MEEEMRNKLTCIIVILFEQISVFAQERIVDLNTNADVSSRNTRFTFK